MSILLVLALAADPVSWDFQDGRAHGWEALNQIENWKPSSDGLRFHSRGEDPYLESPSIEHAASPYDELEIELSVSTGGAAQVFWKVAGDAWYAEERSLPFRVDRAGEVVTVRLPVGEHPAWTGKVLQLRMDPCVQAADVRLISLRVVRTPPPPVQTRVWVEPIEGGRHRVRLQAIATESFDPESSDKAVRTLRTIGLRKVGGDPAKGDLRLSSPGDQADVAWDYDVDLQRAVPVLVIQAPDRSHVVPLAVAPRELDLDQRPSPAGGACLISGNALLLCSGFGFFVYRRGEREWRLAGEGTLLLECELDSSRVAGTLQWTGWEGDETHLDADLCTPFVRAVVHVEVVPDGFAFRVRAEAYSDAAARHLAVVRYRPGFDAAEEKATSAILPGLEYLGDGEASSSTLDCEGPEHRRLAPDRLKVTAPFMAVGYDGSVSGILWDAAAPLSPVFDVPNRVEGVGGALLSLVYPPVPEGTPENRLRSLVPVPRSEWDGKEFSFTLFALPGDDVTDAVRHYVAHRGLLESPKPPRASAEQAALSLGAFLDGPLFAAAARGWGHCQEPNWGRAPAADVCYLLDLYADSAQAELAGRLRARVGEVLERIPPAQRLLSGISHVRPEAVTLRLGGTAEALGGLKGAADAAVADMREDGSWRYEGEYARGHSSDTALGICAPRVIQLLRYVRLQGSTPHLEAARKALARLDRFDVPRGAQTWEVPLHTPDILASAQAVEAFVLAYELTEDRAYLDSAVRWAWTGVPFVYLWGDLHVMRYATIPVFGATNWQAPVWFGTPVQWCGLVYAWSLYRLAEHVPDGPWKKLADGITISGMQQQYPDGVKAGCFPDVFYLRAQQRAGPTINPAPLLVLQAFLEGRNPDLVQTRVRALRVVHLPGLRDLTHDVGKLSFTLPEGSRAQELVVIGGMLQPVEGCTATVRCVTDGGSTASVLSLPGPGRYEFSLVH